MKKAINYIFLLTTLMFFTCEPEYHEPYETYTISKGSHGLSLKGQSLQTNQLTFKAIFDESAIYQSTTEENQHDTNKLLGFADCNSHHHQNSARFGWRWLNDQLEIMAYCYVDGERHIESVGYVDFDEPSNYSLSLKEDHYLFQLEGFPSVEIPREPPCERGLYYMLFPYFGGNDVAPHDISIKIQMNY
ncbi:MAG: hypothetical protein MK076_11665 [Flavobacteriales bacterium]|nr:hypothetical protein [Flavobacteriales bacterium]